MAAPRKPWTILLLAAAALLCACRRTRGPDSLLLVTVDTLRPDALSWVSGGDATPELDALAREGVAFPAAVTPAPLTLPAHASLLTGLVPRRHGARDNGQPLAEGVTTLGEVLRARGYVTGAVVSGHPLRRLYGLDRGFDRYDDELPAGDGGFTERPAPRTTELALSWLEAQLAADAGRPWALWVHYYDPHDPYTPPDRLRRPGPRGAYDGEVAAVDEAFGALRRGVDRLQAGRPHLTVMTADHGESLGEHGEATHGFFLYDATMLVPLVFHAPGHLAPRRIELPARLVDVAPTILGLLGIDSPAGLDGVDLGPALRGEPLPPSPAFLETLQPWLGYGWAPLRAVRHEGRKLVLAPRPELYDLASDPGETRDLSGRDPAVERRLAAIAAEVEAVPPVSSRPVDDPEALASLRALGYLGGAASSSAAGEGLADPKDRLEAKRTLESAERALGAGDADAALAAFDAVLAVEPDNRYALLRSSAALAQGGRFAEALPRLDRLVALDPEHAEAAFHLADALARLGDVARAAAAWRRVVELQPRRAVAWSNLGAVLVQAGDRPGALDALGRAVGLEPGNQVLRANLAEVRIAVARDEAGAGRAARARELLGLALEAEPRLRARVAADPVLGPLLPAP